MERLREPWPADDAELVALQERLGLAAAEQRALDPYQPGADLLVGSCIVAFARGEAGPGRPGDRAWAAAVAWRPPPTGAAGGRSVDQHLQATGGQAGPRRSDDVVAQAVVADRVPASYVPGLLARREGPILQACLNRLEHRPDVVLVDATGRDHPRGAGLAVHLGAAVGLPTVGVTHRGLGLRGDPPPLTRRGEVAEVELDGEVVAAWVCTRTGVRPLLVHPAWRTEVAVAVEVVLRTSTEQARTPVPLQEARRVAREARTLAGAG
jgi:deoxyribonuclease V